MFRPGCIDKLHESDRSCCTTPGRTSHLIARDRGPYDQQEGVIPGDEDAKWRAVADLTDEEFEDVLETSVWYQRQPKWVQAWIERLRR